MVGILVLLIVSWLLFYLDNRASLLALGFSPMMKQISRFAMTFLISAGLCAAVLYLESTLSASTWSVDREMDTRKFLQMFWWDATSVLTEELVFRGAIFMILMRRLGESRGIMISSVAFGIYHWFSFGIIGNIIPMLIVFLGTGLMGYAWALAFAKTRSILTPVGFHLGWNFTFNSIFSRGPLGVGLLHSHGGQPLSDWFSLVGLWGVPIIMFVVVNYLIPRENAGPEKQTFTSAKKVS